MNEKWKKLTVKSENIKLGDDLTIEVKGLTFKDLGHLSEFNDKKDFVGASNYLLFSAVRRAVPVEGTDSMSDVEVQEVIDNLNNETVTTIINKVMELSGFKKPEEPKNLVSTSPENG
jgi:hypothetical protein